MSHPSQSACAHIVSDEDLEAPTFQCECQTAVSPLTYCTWQYCAGYRNDSDNPTTPHAFASGNCKGLTRNQDVTKT